MKLIILVKQTFYTDNDKNVDTFKINKNDFEQSYINIVTVKFFFTK